MSASSKRIQNELAEMSRKAIDGSSAGPKNGNIYAWSSAITGPAGSAYEGGVFFLDIVLPMEYPSAPPKESFQHCCPAVDDTWPRLVQVTFRTPIYHCNIRKDGTVGIDILHGAWRPALTINAVLTTIHELLANPRPEHALVGSVAHQLLNDRATHDKVAADWTQRFAKL